MPPEGDYNSRAAADGLLKGIAASIPSATSNTALLVYGAGDGGGGPARCTSSVNARARPARPAEGQTRKAARVLPALEQREVAHTHVGELYLETHQGTYTTQGAIKKYNRLIERKLHNAEALAVITRDDSRPALERTGRMFCLNQFHDIIPGSSIERVNTRGSRDVPTHRE